MATFYTGVDKSIYQGGDHYVPMEKFRLNPYEQKNLSYESSQPKSYGITNTNAFTNSGGAFNASGNAFGYGSAIGPSQGYGQYGTPSYTGGLPGNVTQQGTGRNFMADMDPNYWEGEPGSEWINSYQMTTGKNKQLPGFANLALSFIPGGNFIRGKIEKGMNDPRVNQSSYRIGGMDDFTKGAYDTLAGEGMLFDGSAGIKTLTGKNFGAKGYFEGQEELAKEFGFDKMDDDEIESYISQFSLQNPKKSFKVKQMKEAWKMSKYRSNKLDQQIKEDNKRAAEEARNAKIAADMKYHNEHTPTATGGMTYNEIVDNMVQDRSEEMRGRPGGIGGKELMATGGRVGLNYGGLASMLGREGFADGGLDWDEGGDTPMPGGGHGSGHEDAVAAMGGNNEPPTDNLNISPFVNTVDGAPVELGAVSNTKLGRLKAMIGFKNLNEALTYGKGDDTVINSLDDVRNLLDPSLSLNTQIGPVDVNAYKDKDIDSYGLRTNIGPVNLGYQDLNNQKRADISYAPNDKFNIGATTDFDNINLGATYNKGPFTVGGTIDDMGNWNTQAGLKYAFNNGGLARLL